MHGQNLAEEASLFEVARTSAMPGDFRELLPEGNTYQSFLINNRSFLVFCVWCL